MASPVTDKTTGDAGDGGAVDARRSAPSPQEQKRREQWGKTHGELVKQAVTQLREREQ